jgi:hypothetical protein
VVSKSFLIAHEEKYRRGIESLKKGDSSNITLQALENGNDSSLIRFMTFLLINSLFFMSAIDRQYLASPPSVVLVGPSPRSYMSD